jgi:outer membrane protein assembly factor BamB
MAQGVLVAADRKGRMQGLDPGTGQIKWSIDLASNTLGDLVVPQDNSSVVLTVTQGGKNGSHLVQIDPTNGSQTLLAPPP